MCSQQSFRGSLVVFPDGADGRIAIDFGIVNNALLTLPNGMSAILRPCGRNTPRTRASLRSKMMSPFDWNGKAVQYGGGSTC
jgi:hypothetical protein